MRPFKGDELVFGTLWELNKSLVKKGGEGGMIQLGDQMGQEEGEKIFKIIVFLLLNKGNIEFCSQLRKLELKKIALEEQTL